MNGLMKVKIFTMAFNRPDLLQQQIDSLNKNLEDDDYEHNLSMIRETISIWMILKVYVRRIK